MEPAWCRLFAIIGNRDMESITAKGNQKYKLWKSLLTRKHREETGLFLMEGAVLLKEAFAAGEDFLDALIVRTGSEEAPGVTELISSAGRLGIRAFGLAGPLFDQLTDTETGKDVIGVFRIPAREIGNVRNGLLILDRLQDPGNMGTVMRTAEAAGFDGIAAVKGTVDAFSPKVVRAASGAVLRLPVVYLDSEEEVLELCRREGLKIAAGDPLGTDLYGGADLSGRIALIIGNEGRGISESLMERADVRVRIPMEGKTESLNAAVAAAILMYETVRQRGQMTCRKN